MNIRITIFLSLFWFFSFSQDKPEGYVTKKVAVKDSIVIDSVSINPSKFVLKRKDSTTIDSTSYSIDFAKALLILNKPVSIDTLIVEYLRYPEFLTKTYRQLDESIIVGNTNNLDKLYKLRESNVNKTFKPFDGLTTYGSISRGVTVGSNQNSVLNSELDLQITGKLNDKVSLRASIQDANIPLQESGYTQRLDEFDQVFIELFSDNWNIRAGDIDLINNDTYYANFSKRVQGLSVNALLDHPDSETQLFAAGAIVRGQFSRSQFTAQEGNQGPYKLVGENGELFVLIVSGSETVYVNGIRVERGENADYIIDYNAGEIIFNSTFPITSEMRITVDYQFSDRNYSRIVAFGGAKYNSDKLKLGAAVYSENDAKNQPLQQNLSTEQVEILADAGDDRSLMVAPSESPEVFSENRILYKKEIINGVEAFVFSNNPEDDLFSVRFTRVGENQGNYVISSIDAIDTIYEYVEPINGILQGNFEPIIQLVAPTKLQLAVINGEYRPTEKTNIDFELTGSKNDLNLFSSIDDDDNDGFAAHIGINQDIIKNDSLWNLKAFAKGDYIHENFRTIERLYNAEFNRDWNLETPLGDQQFLIGGLHLNHYQKGLINYQFEHLNYFENFNGNRHVLFANLNLGNLFISSNSSLLNSDSNIDNSTFLRSSNRVVYRYNKGWTGARFDIEDNEQRLTQNNELTPISQRFSSYEVFSGIGDSSNVYLEVGYKHRVNDSIRNNELERVNRSNTYYLKSHLIKSTNADLVLFANYRVLKNEDQDLEDEQSLNSRLQYSQKLFKQLVQWNTVFETNSGTLPLQDFTYVEVEPGQGAYTWIDYNGNGIQELEEFELAQFQDQGNYIRVLLPNQIFVKTHQNRLSQTLTINPQIYFNNLQKESSFWSRWYNQTSYLIDRKDRREGSDFNLNPFDPNSDDQLALQLNFRNTLFYNRGKQQYTTSYTYLSNKAQNALTAGIIKNELQSHLLDFNHKFSGSWLITVISALENSKSESENFSTRNFDIDEVRLNPKLSYFLNDNVRFDLFYQYNDKENTIGAFEMLEQQNYGASFTYAPQSGGQKATITGEFNFFSNDFTGNPNTPVGYQMMEGLQPGKNYTWNLLAQKRLTKFLDLNLSYFGRKSEDSNAIHTGSVQLRAYF